MCITAVLLLVLLHASSIFDGFGFPADGERDEMEKREERTRAATLGVENVPRHGQNSRTEILTTCLAVLERERERERGRERERERETIENARYTTACHGFYLLLPFSQSGQSSCALEHDMCNLSVEKRDETVNTLTASPGERERERT